jgi:hypothetical protein
MVTSFLRARIARKATERLDIEPACAMCPRLRKMEHRRRKATLSSKREEERHAHLHFYHTAHEFTDEVAGAARDTGNPAYSITA